MADHGPVKIRSGNIDDLIVLYKYTYSRMVKEITTATEAGKINKARVMARINAELTALGVNVDEWVKRDIPQYYLDGANVAIQDLRALGIDVSKSTNFAIINQEAIKALTDEVALSFAQGITALSRNARRTLDDTFKRQLNFIIAQGKLTGDTRKEISNALKQRLQDEGIQSITDRGGREWSFDTYTRMLARTKAVEARNQGLINRMLSVGYDLVQVTRHNSTHKACRDLEGKILSITGATPAGTKLPGGFEVWGTLDAAKAHGLFHPNCEHAINVFNADLAAKTKVYDAASGQYVDGGKPEVDILSQGGARTEHAAQKAMEDALNAGDKVTAQKIVNGIQDPDLKMGLQGTLDSLEGKKRRFKIDPVTKKIIPL